MDFWEGGIGFKVATTMPEDGLFGKSSFVRSCYPPCLSETVEGILVHPLEVVHIKQIRPPEKDLVCFVKE